MHFWDQSLFSYPWLASGDAVGLPAAYGVDDWARDTSAVELTAVVHVQAEVDHAEDPVGETEWMQHLHDAHGVPSACIGYADLRDESLGDVLDRHTQYPVFRGIRQEAWFDPRSARADVPRHNLLDDPAFLRGLRQLEKRDLVFELLVWQEQLGQAADLLRQVPDLRLVINHLAVPSAEDRRDAWELGIAQVLDAGHRSMLKVSGLGMVDAKWSANRIDPLIARALRVAGPSRVVFASNFPVEPAGVTYEAVWETFSTAISEYSPNDQEAMLRGNALAFYSIHV